MNKSDLSIRQASEQDKPAWDKIVNHPLQSWEWGEFRRSQAVDVVRFALIKNRSLIDGWQVTFHKIPHTPWTIGYFPKGSMPTPLMIEQLRLLGQQKNAVFIQLEPNVIIKDTQISGYTDTQNKNQKLLSILISQYPSILKPSHHPLFTKYTFILDLTRSETELLASMHPKTRYNIKVAQKHGVIIKEDNSESAFSKYIELTRETTRRQGFYAHDENYHRNMWRLLSKAGVAKLWTASYNNTIISAWIIFVRKDTVYYPYGASSRGYREVMAPNLLLWEIARWAKRAGYKQFDLWGALGPNPDTKDPWFGFHRFKAGFTPKHVEFIGSYDLIIKPLHYRLYTLADSFRWFVLHALKHS